MDVTKFVTAAVLFAYIALVALFFCAAAGEGMEIGKWYELTKTGFTTLGSALTLILGYYFGQKQSADAKEMRQEEKEKIKELKQQEEIKREELVQKLVPNSTESQPESRASVKERLPARRPKQHQKPLIHA